ncbi:MAG: RimK family alpha-L-glutamate ligase [Nanoarchaeota archaeon]|nr:RimK family alpha-L-glutamate ligase [Nanoarchaeota archaeon]
MVNIGLLANKTRHYSTRRLIEEGKTLNQNIISIGTGNICLFVDNQLRYTIHRKKSPIDVILPRFGDRHWNFFMTVLKHFERTGIPCINTSETIDICKNKYLTSLALKKKRVPQPKCALAFSEKDMLTYIKKMEKPLVLKLIDQSFGQGVSRINDDIEAEDWLETVLSFKSPIYIQEYIPHPGEDYRILVINHQVVGAMKRKAKPGEWKANIALGGTPCPYRPTEEVKEIAIKSSEAVKAGVCGVDLMIHEGIPKVIEVNHNPQFKGLEQVSKNIAKEIMKYTVRKAKR